MGCWLQFRVSRVLGVEGGVGVLGVTLVVVGVTHRLAFFFFDLLLPLLALSKDVFIISSDLCLLAYTVLRSMNQNTTY